MVWVDNGDIVYSFHCYTIYTTVGNNRILVIVDTGGTAPVLRLDATGGILKVGLFARLFCEKFIFLGVVTQCLHINPQDSRQNAAFFIRSKVAGVALFLLQR